MQTAEADRRGDDEPPHGSGALALGRELGLFDIGEDAAGTFQITRAGVGQRHLPRGPLQQPRAQPLLQRRDQPRHRRRRQAKFACSRRKPLQVRHRDEGLHGFDPVHGFIPLFATMNCQQG